MGFDARSERLAANFRHLPSVGVRRRGSRSRHRRRIPNDNQVALYSSVGHCPEAVTKAGADETGAVMKAMREAPIHDIFTANAVIRADGRGLP